MPTAEEKVTFAALVELGRRRGRAEWKRAQQLELCKPVTEMCSHPSALSRLELSMLAYGYRDELHNLNARAELERLQKRAAE